MCIDQWQGSFVHGDLSDRKTLRGALAYQNYEHSPKHIQVEAAKVMQGMDCEGLLELKKSFFANDGQCGLGNEVPFSADVAYFVIRKQKLFPNPGFSAKFLPEDLLDKILRLNRNVLFISDWTDACGSPALPPPDQVDCAELVQALGLCGVMWKEGAEITILGMKMPQARKSTWLDSGLAFYWHAVPDQPNWGLTRSLKSGRPALREWVVRKQAGIFDIEAYWDRKFEQNCDLRVDKLNADYWDACAKELRP
ncbi:MAG: hypothetical protein K8F27_10130 [Sulfuricellaceae bacterium]|nr:hypothetical protein [Sulfuricellaceae bacterium]